MKNIVKKISSVLMAIMLICGIYVLSSPVDALADEEYHVRFHYSRTDNNYSDYYINVYETGANGENHNFKVVDNEGIYEYIFTRTEDVDAVNFIIKAYSDDSLSLTNNENVDLAEGSSMDIYITGDTKDTAVISTTAPQTQSSDEPASSEETPAADPQTTSAQQETPASVDTSSSEGPVDSSTIYQEDDKTKDYSVGILQAIIFDVVLFAIIGGASYVLLSKEKKAKA